MEVMCRKHLMGEHVECHMFLGTLEKGKKLNGYLSKGLFDLRLLQSRHDELANEMLRRGYKHNSPLNVSKLLLSDSEKFYGHVNIEENLKELSNRCFDCDLLIKSKSYPQV